MKAVDSTNGFLKFFICLKIEKHLQRKLLKQCRTKFKQALDTSWALLEVRIKFLPRHNTDSPGERFEENFPGYCHEE
jgi:hypothetical protein